MKKYFLPASVSLCIGIFMAYFIISQYKSLDKITVSSKAEEVYFIERGIYSDKENMENNMKDFSNYIYNVEDNMYHTYIGISNNINNANKIKKVYKNLGYDLDIKKKVTDNNDFINILSQYDDVLEKTEDEESIKVICNQVLSNYEEYKDGKYKN